jgi:hypothetical protein
VQCESQSSLLVLFCCGFASMLRELRSIQRGHLHGNSAGREKCWHFIHLHLTSADMKSTDFNAIFSWLYNCMSLA